MNTRTLLDTGSQKINAVKIQKEVEKMSARSWNTKQVAMIVVIAALTLAGTLSYAQFPGLGGNKQSGTGSGGDVNAYGKSVADAATKGLTARICYLDAQAKLAEALGIKTEAYVKASESARAAEGASASKQVEAIKSSTVTPEAKKEMEDALAESKELSAESKKKFSEGGGKFIVGVVAESGLVKQVTDLVQQGNKMAQAANPLDKVKVLNMVKPVTDLASILPGDVKEGTTTISAITKFAQKQNIEIPGADTVKDKLGGL